MNATRTPTWIALSLVLAAVGGHAQEPPRNQPSGPNRNGPGPWNNDVVAYRITPGAPPEKLANFGPAGVPTVARTKDGRLIAAFQWFPNDNDRFFDRVAVRFSGDEGESWTDAAPIEVNNMDPSLMRPFDPTLVPLPDGKIRLYFTSNQRSARGPGEPAIHSAISADGIHYEFEPGARFAIRGRMVIDCAAALCDGVYHLVVPNNGDAGRPPGGNNPSGESGSAYHAVSKDGLHFERIEDLTLPDRRGRWLGNLTNATGGLAFFGTGPGRWPITSKDGKTWTETERPVPVPGADPGAVKRRDGSWLLLVTSMRQANGGALPNNRPGGQANPPNRGLASHRVLSASSADGLSWTRDPGVRIESASVPCAVNDGDRRILIYYVKPPDQPGRLESVACSVSTDGIRFQPAVEFRIDGLSKRKAVDPSIIRNDAGRFLLYYLASDHQGDPARAPNPHPIHLATSDDGLRFKEAGPVFSHDGLVDPDVFRTKDNWLMYVFAGKRTIVAESGDGRRFSYLRDLGLENWGTTAPVTLPGGKLRLYAFEQRVPQANSVRSFTSSDGLTWNPEDGIRLKADTGEQITDPYVIPWKGGWKMFFKTNPAMAPGDRPGPPDSHRPPQPGRLPEFPR
ncbi:MAG: exo-alpha-sialidase [Verrucomicrobia bacterium]|nr:exo-alpha-sialidase [Verrucomicrobiota bacterium]